MPVLDFVILFLALEAYRRFLALVPKVVASRVPRTNAVSRRVCFQLRFQNQPRVRVRVRVRIRVRIRIRVRVRIPNRILFLAR